MKKGKRYSEKKRPLTKKAMEELEERLKTDPRLAREFAKDCGKVLASQRYFITEDFRKELIKEVENSIKEAGKKLPSGGKKIFKKMERGEAIEAKVKIDRKKKTKNIRIR